MEAKVRRSWWNALVCGGAAAIGVACGSATEESGEDTDPGGACGDVTTHEVTVSGTVEDADGAVDGASVHLEERNWEPGTLGTGTTGTDGTFSLDVTVTSVENCWATALDYVVVATAGDLSVERGVNQSLFNAIDDESGTAELGVLTVE